MKVRMIPLARTRDTTLHICSPALAYVQAWSLARIERSQPCYTSEQRSVQIFASRQQAGN